MVIIAEAESWTDRQRFAQFRRTDTEIIAELSDEEPLASESNLGRELLTEAGWRTPQADHMGNWWFELPWPADSSGCHRLAAMITSGLREALRIPEPSALTYTAWNERQGNRGMDLPLLGLSPNTTSAR
ncbi:hypothetical protein JK358_12425 [Nocardia sp. 2]|uniref:TY-Chap N-terminal domain-containing protein n=1 Tax=Nocardia acididurans TaxID=2802282 RepID=A0ABS1M3F2_9NOCA|nr:hypothetical protein [Nocardia acididurans]MBL1075198.1 hypothetical protein [Nocardia acididurans]